MITRLGAVTIYIRDYDEALAFYVDTLGLEKRADTPMPGGNNGARWLTVAPAGERAPEIVLQRPGDFHDEDAASILSSRIGHGTPWVYHTDDCAALCAHLRERGVTIEADPAERPYGIEAVVQDPYGNPLVLLQPREQ